MLEKIIDFCLKRSHLVIATFVVLFLFCLFQIPNIKQVSDVSQLASRDDDIILLNSEMDKVFGSTRLSLMTIKDAFNHEQLKLIQVFIKDLEKNKDIKDVISLFSEKYLAGANGSFEVQDLALRDLPNEVDIKSLKQKLKSFPLYYQSLFSGNDLNITIQFDNSVTDQEMHEIITQSIQKIDGDTSKWFLSGWPEINNSIKGIMDRDLMILVPLIYLIIAIVFFALFRSLRGIIIPSITIGVGIVFAVGFMPLFDLSLNVVSNAIPTLLVAIGTSDGVHYMAKYYHYSSQFKDHHKLIKKATMVIAPTIILTSITTMGGFLSNIFNPVNSIAEFGLITAVGVFGAGLASFILIPAILSKFKLTQKEQKQTTKIDLIIGTYLEKIFQFVQNQKKLITLTSTLGLLACIYLALGLKPNYSLLGYFKPDSSVVTDAQIVSKNFGGIIEFNIVVDTNKADGLINAQTLKVIDEEVRAFKALHSEDISFITSLADYIKNMSRAYNGEQTYYKIPSDSDEIGQYLEVYSWSGDSGDDLKYVTNLDYSIGRIYGRFLSKKDEQGHLKERNISYYEGILNEFSSKLRQRLDPQYNIFQYGELPMWISTLHKIVEGQVKSVLAAIVVVFLIIFPILKSLSLTLIGLVPILISVFFNFAFMKVFNINLDIATSLVSAMAIGIGIDDALHFLITYKRNLNESQDDLACLKETVLSTGKAIFSTSLTLVLGYSVFFFSSFKPLNYFGLLNILTIIMATIATIFIVPALIIIIKPKNKRISP